MEGMADESNYLSRESKMSSTRLASVECRVFLAWARASTVNLGHQFRWPFLSSSGEETSSSMSNDHEFQYHLTNGGGGPSYSDMDDAFCARMRKAIEAGLESAPIGIITTPGTKRPKYIPTDSTEPLTSSWAI
jgi:hypothetical protein